MYTGNCGHAIDCNKWLTGCGECPRLRRETKSLLLDRTHASWEKMKTAFDGFDKNLYVVSVSPWLMARAKQSPILENKMHYVVLNGIDTVNCFHFTTSRLRRQFQLEDKKVVLHVTASYSNPIKGGQYVAELANKMSEYTFIVIGNINRELKLPPNVIDIGRIEDQRELAAYYSMADVLLLTSKRETFCMPVAESLCCGTPVVGFQAGAPEQIALPEYSEFVEWGDIDALENAVKRWCAIKYDPRIIALTAGQRYSKEAMVKEYYKIYSS